MKGRALLIAVGVLTALGGGVARAAAPPTDPPPDDSVAVDETATASTVPQSEIFGTGISGSEVTSTTDCPINTYVTTSNECAPSSSPLPQGTVALAIDATCPITGDLETNPDGSPTFTTSAEMKTLLECVIPEAVAWMTWEYGSLVPPSEWQSTSGSLLPNNFVWVPHGVTLTGETCDGTPDRPLDSTNSLHYCPTDGNIYFGEDQMWSDYTEHGDADIWGSISHEMGHRIQHVANAHDVNPDVPNEEIPSENMADCFSGAFLAYSARLQDSVETTSGDDVFDLFIGLFNIGEPESELRTHGTIDQRVRAFYVGYDSAPSRGVFDCAFYYTDVSIIPLSASGDVSQAPTTTVVQETSSHAAATPTTAPTPVPAPTPTLQPSGLGTDGALDQLASACFSGTMSACDTLYSRAPQGSLYQSYGDTCAGRQPEGTGLYCADVFTDTAAGTTVTTAPGPTAPVPTTTAPAPTTTGPAPTTTGPAPTTTGPNAPSTPTALTTVQAVADVCIPQVVSDWPAEVAAHTLANPGAMQAVADGQGNTLTAYQTDLLRGFLDNDDPANPTWLLGDPYERRGEGADAPITEWGLLFGTALDCVLNTLVMPQDLFDHYLEVAEGDAEWDGWRLVWFFDTLEDGSEHYFVRLSRVA